MQESLGLFLCAAHAGAHSIHHNILEVEAGEYEVEDHSWLDSSPGVSETLTFKIYQIYQRRM